MSNQTVGNFLVYILISIYAIFGLGSLTVILARSKKSKLSVLTFAVLTIVSVSGFMAYRKLPQTTAVQYMSYMFAGIETAFLLLVVGMALTHNERLKNVGWIVWAIGAIIGIGISIWLFVLLLIT